MKAIINANIIMPDHVIPNGVILIDGENHLRIEVYTTIAKRS